MSIERMFIGERYPDTPISINTLRKDWQQQWFSGEVPLFFEDYLKNCLSKNGTLKEVKRK